MQGFELSDYIKSLPALKDNFVGVFAINIIPKRLKKRHFFFCNTDLNTGNGIHWQCVLKNDLNQIEYFDSLGVDELKLQNFAKYCTISCKSLLFNKTAVQSQSTDSCGYFCLYFIINRLFNFDISFDNLLNEIFQKNSDENESIVKDFFVTDVD